MSASKPYFGIPASTTTAGLPSTIVRIPTSSPTGFAGRQGAARTGAAIALGILALGLTTLGVTLLERGDLAIDDASPIYLIAVVLMGAAFGTAAAVGTAIAAFLAYDALFTAPRGSLLVADPREWLDLLLFLFVALAVGRLVAIAHRRADAADRRTREANSLFALSRLLATADTTEDAAPAIATRLRSDARLERAWIAIGPVGHERVVADTGAADGPPPRAPVIASLVRQPGDEPARWIRTHEATAAAPSGMARRGTSTDREQYRVRIESDGVVLGTLGATRARALGLPTREETRVLALSADQVALSVRRDQAHRAATELEVARQSDLLKTALIDSVSHDLRTPLASIRATAGSLADPAVDWTDDRRRAAAVIIDQESARLDRLVRAMLDLGRIDAGAVRVELEAHDLASVVPPVVDRLRPLLMGRDMVVDIPLDIPPVEVDAVLLEAVLTNLLENAATHAPPPAAVRLRAERRSIGGDLMVRLVVEDGGQGVPADKLGRVFDRFHRVPGGAIGGRRGMGVGLSVVKGLTEAMGGRAEAAASPLGGLAIAIDLRASPDAPEPDA